MTKILIFKIFDFSFGCDKEKDKAAPQATKSPQLPSFSFGAASTTSDAATIDFSSLTNSERKSLKKEMAKTQKDFRAYLSEQRELVASQRKAFEKAAEFFSASEKSEEQEDDVVYLYETKKGKD